MKLKPDEKQDTKIVESSLSWLLSKHTEREKMLIFFNKVWGTVE